MELNELWKEMEQMPKRYGICGGYRFADRFCDEALKRPLAEWEKLNPEIVYYMLIYELDRLDCRHLRAMGSKDFSDDDWYEMLGFEPRLIFHPDCPKNWHPSDMLRLLPPDLLVFYYHNLDNIADELDPTELAVNGSDTFEPEAIYALRKRGLNRFADWLVEKVGAAIEAQNAKVAAIRVKQKSVK